MKTRENKTRNARSARARVSRIVANRRRTMDNLAGIQRLMEMQNHMAALSGKQDSGSMFDGIPAGASPYFFYSMSAKKA